MKVELVTEVDVACFAAFAEVAFVERRPELGLLCSAARDADGRITSELVQEILPGTSRSAAMNIRRWCEHLGLCDGGGALTRVGRGAAESDLAPVPEQGVYEFWVATHPLFGTRVLHAQRLVSDKDQRFDDIQHIPLEPDPDVEFRSVIDPDQRLVFRSFMSNHDEPGCLRRGESARVGLRWRWDMDGASNTWTLDGHLGGGERGAGPVGHAGESADVDIWGLFAALARRALSSEGTWDESDQRLGVAFDGLGQAEVEDFRKRVDLNGTEVPGYGYFASIVIDGVPLKPRGAPDAQAWAEARLRRSLERGAACHSREDVRRLWARRVGGTPLEPFGPALPSHEQLLEASMEHPAVYWSLAAPVDLAPEPVPRETLDVMGARRGSGTSEDARGKTVRVPHGARWSMQDLVCRLVPSGALRVVLCDRFVRGEENLRMLEVLGATVREAAARAEIEIVTDQAKDGASNVPRIRELTGRPLRLYDDVFGSSRRDHPHDRYLLVRGPDGAFAWQLSNSPLDARGPDGTRLEPSTPLRWRDLSATHLTLEELPPSLADLVGGAG